MPYLKSCLLVLIAGLIGLAAITNNASACGFNTNLKPPSISELADNADIVVIGQAIGGGFTRSGATVRVEKYLKGTGPDILFTEGYIKLPAYCSSGEDFWSRKIYYFRNEDDMPDPTRAWQLWTFAHQQAADDETVAEISSYTGRLTEPIPASFRVRIAATLVYFNTDDFLFITTGCLFPLALVLAIFLVRCAIIRRRQVKLSVSE